MKGTEMKTRLRVKLDSHKLEVSMYCDCGLEMEVFSHNSKDQVSYFCKRCAEKYNFLIRVRPPNESCECA